MANARDAMPAGRVPPRELLGALASFLPHSSFTKVQTDCIPSLFSCDDNALIAAPTGSGKTLLLEVAMLRLFRDRLSAPCTSAATQNSPKVVYVCPIKALAAEKFAAWSTLFVPLTVAIETGDQERFQSDSLNLNSVITADIIVTTPERWDSITRRWKERTVLGLVNSVGLLLLDEIHTVGEERGAVLEALVSRMKAIRAATNQSHRSTASQECAHANATSCHTGCRFVAVSGTLPNIDDVGEWLDVPPAMRFTFSEADRPVPLTTRVLGFNSDSHNPFVFDRFLTFKLFSLIREHGEGKPALVFCASRKETVTASQRIAEDIREAAARGGFTTQLDPSRELKQRIETVSDKQLKAGLLIGVAFHHAALSLNDRQVVEQLFRDQFISVLCTTTTLALGVNLPAHLVIVKGTTFFKSGSREDIPLSEAAQMCGRAGRPGLDTHGVALILTTADKVTKYERLRNGTAFTIIESRLHQHMIEHVNAEVALRTIHSFDSAVSWVKTTFFWIRLRRNPSQYGLRFETVDAGESFDAAAFVSALLRRVLEALCDERCVVGVAPSECRRAPDLDPLSRIEISGVGRAMSRLYILFDTVKTYNRYIQEHRFPGGGKDDTSPPHTSSQPAVKQPSAADVTEDADTDAANGDATAEASSGKSMQRQTLLTGTKTTLFDLCQVLTLLAHSQEFQDVRLRQGDRGHLNELNKGIKFPINSGKRGGREVREDWHKALVLIQAPLSQLALTDMSLRNDSMRLWSAVPRVVRFLCEYSWLSLSYSLALHADLLVRCVDSKVWPDGCLLRQFPLVTDTVARALVKGGLRTFESITNVDARHLEVVCGRLPPFGNQLKAAVMTLPQPTVAVRRRAAEAVAQDDGGCHSRYANPSSTTYSIDVFLHSRQHTTDNCNGRDAVNAKGYHAENKSRSKRHAEGAAELPLLLLVGHGDTDAVLLKRFVPCGTASAQHTFEVRVPHTMAPHTVTVHVITPELVGNDVTAALEVKAPSPCEPATSAAGESTLIPTNEAAGTEKVDTVEHRTAKRRLSRKRMRDVSEAISEPDAAAAQPAQQDNTNTAVASNTAPSPQKKSDPAIQAIAVEAREAYDALLADFQYVSESATATKHKIKPCRGATNVTPIATANVEHVICLSPVQSADFGKASKRFAPQEDCVPHTDGALADTDADTEAALAMELPFASPPFACTMADNGSCIGSPPGHVEARGPQRALFSPTPDAASWVHLPGDPRVQSDHVFPPRGVMRGGCYAGQCGGPYPYEHRAVPSVYYGATFASVPRDAYQPPLAHEPVSSHFRFGIAAAAPWQGCHIAPFYPTTRAFGPSEMGADVSDGRVASFGAPPSRVAPGQPTYGATRWPSPGTFRGWTGEAVSVPGPLPYSVPGQTQPCAATAPPSGWFNHPPWAVPDLHHGVPPTPPRQQSTSALHPSQPFTENRCSALSRRGAIPKSWW